MAARHGQLLNAVLKLCAVYDVIVRKQNTGCVAYQVKNKRRFVRFNAPGTPDIEGYFGKSWGPFKGHHIAIEVKVGRDEISELQWVYLWRVNANGGLGVQVRDTVDNIEAILKERRKLLKP